MRHRVPIHAYRLRYQDSSHTPEMLWEWEESYIQHLFWNAKTFGRTVVHCIFLHWNALDAANQRIWETAYLPRALFEPWESWQAWIAEYRTLLAVVQDVYEAQHGVPRDDANVEP
jgi:hypothetical protein